MKKLIKKLLFSKSNQIKPVQWGGLRKVKPVSNTFGYDRGQSINRYYIEKFIKKHKNAITGNVLEFGDNRYTTKYGSCNINKSDVIHPNNRKQGVTIISDIVQSDDIPDNSFDCIICIQTLQFIFDFDKAVEKGIISADQDMLEPVFYIEPEIGREWLEETLTKAFYRVRNCVFPPDRLDSSLEFMHKIGAPGTLGDLLVRKKRG